MRVAVGGFGHETNTFAVDRTELDAFKRYPFAPGQEIFDKFHGTRTELGGFLEFVRSPDWELAPSVFAAVVPSVHSLGRSLGLTAKRATWERPMQTGCSFPKERAFTDAEYSRRLASARKRMEDADLDALLIFDPSNICYLAGHHSVNLWDYQCLVVPLDFEPFIILWQFELGRFQASSWLKKATCYRTEEDPITFTSKALEQEGLTRRRLGIELGSRYLPAQNYRKLREGLGSKPLVDGSGIVEAIRVRKSDEELKILRKAATITSAGMKAALQQVREGALDFEIAAEANRALISGGSEFTCIEPIVAVGHRAGLAHSSYNGTRVKLGDTVFVELGACVNRYTAPLMRTAVAGEVPREVQSLADYSSRAIHAMIEAIRPGVRACDVARQGREALAPIEATIAFHYVFGYSVGVGFPPSWIEGSNFFLRSDNRALLESGMVFHLPMTLRVFGRLGVGFSETVEVTHTGCATLTQLERRLAVH